jgi:hypothetical protein
MLYSPRFSDAFPKFPKVLISFHLFVCLSVCPNVSARPSLDGLPRSLIMGTLTKICRKKKPNLITGCCKLLNTTNTFSFGNTPSVGVSWAGETANNMLQRWSFLPTSSVALTYSRFKQFYAGQRTRPTSGPRSCLCLFGVMKMVLLAEEDKVPSGIELLLSLLLQ